MELTQGGIDWTAQVTEEERKRLTEQWRRLWANTSQRAVIIPELSRWTFIASATEGAYFAADLIGAE